MDYVILLTMTIDNQACYQPNDERQHYIYMRDSVERVSCYLKSLDKWLQTSHTLVIVENSRDPKIEELRTRIRDSHKKPPTDYSTSDKSHYLYDNVEFISYKGNEESVLYGKGNGEKKSIAYALENSHLIQSQFIIKITGRYAVESLEPITSVLDEKTQVACKYMQLHKLTDTRIFGFSRLFFEKLQVQEINDKRGISMERGVASTINKMIENNPEYLKIIKRSFKVYKTMSGMKQVITRI
tara:strand:+ start:530 stop:1252 length:723 start_codon:yes stop_codon:yes gene_type:complete